MNGNKLLEGYIGECLEDIGVGKWDTKGTNHQRKIGK